MRRIKLVVGAIVATSACLYYNQYISTPLPIRALNLSTKCQFTLKSIRDEDVKVIKYRMSAPRPVEDMFTVVCGPRGIGKSTAINSAANGLRGVIKISSVKPGTSSDEILDDVCCKITGLRNGSWKKNEDSMKKVISWIQTFTGRSPVIIIPAGQRFEGNIAAGLTEAARILTTDYELNVVIDSAENALPTTLSGREFMIEMKPMTNEMMRKLPGFEDVFETLKKQGNEDIVMRLCAGRPIVLKQFKSKLELCYTEEEKLTAVNFYVREMLEKALERVAKHPEIKEFLKRFQQETAVKYDPKMDWPDFKDVLRLVSTVKSGRVLVPATGAVAIVLRYGLENEIDIEKIKKAALAWPSEDPY